MCWCNDFEFTINRADEYMVREKTADKWYVISPPVLIALIEQAVNYRNAYIEERDEGFLCVSLPRYKVWL